MTGAHRAGNSGVHVAGTVPRRRGGRPPRRHLLARLHALRAAHRPAPVPGHDRRRTHDQARLRPAGPAGTDRRPRAQGNLRRDPADDGQASGRPLPDDGRGDPHPGIVAGRIPRGDVFAAGRADREARGVCTPVQRCACRRPAPAAPDRLLHDTDARHRPHPLLRQTGVVIRTGGSGIRIGRGVFRARRHRPPRPPVRADAAVRDGTVVGGLGHRRDRLRALLHPVGHAQCFVDLARVRPGRPGTGLHTALRARPPRPEGPARCAGFVRASAPPLAAAGSRRGGVAAVRGQVHGSELGRVLREPVRL